MSQRGGWRRLTPNQVARLVGRRAPKAAPTGPHLPRSDLPTTTPAGLPRQRKQPESSAGHPPQSRSIRGRPAWQQGTRSNARPEAATAPAPGKRPAGHPRFRPRPLGAQRAEGPYSRRAGGLLNGPSNRLLLEERRAWRSSRDLSAAANGNTEPPIGRLRWGPVTARKTWPPCPERTSPPPGGAFERHWRRPKFPRVPSNLDPTDSRA